MSSQARSSTPTCHDDGTHRAAQLTLGLQPVIRVVAVLAASLTVQLERATSDVALGHI
jgi:hypothetical protein